MATRATRMPLTVARDGRSPSHTLATAGTTTAHTAVVGATIAIVPIASARYSRATPALPATPAARPQFMSALLGDASGSTGSRSISASSPDACVHTTTATVDAAREARPPRK